MTTYAGKEGVIQIGANAVAEVKEFAVNTHAEVVDDTAKGDDWRTHKVTFKTWDGTLSCMWDDTDTNGQMACVEGASITVDLYPGGTDSGRIHLTGTATITERTIESPEELAMHNITFQGNGALTEEAVA
jgi:hypothetical protein